MSGAEIGDRSRQVFDQHVAILMFCGSPTRAKKKPPLEMHPPSPQNAMLRFQFPMFVRKVASETICLEGIGPSNFAKWGGGGGGFYFALTGLRRFCLSSSNHFPDVAQASACRSLSAVLHSRSCLVRRICALHGSTSVPQ